MATIEPGTAGTTLRPPAGGAPAGARDAPAGSLGLTGRPVRLRAAVGGILALATISVVLAATGDHVRYPAATALYYGVMVAASMLVGLYWFVRRPGSAFGALLAAFGASMWVMSWQSSEWVLAFDIGVLAEGVMFILTFVLFLAFPTGRLRTRTDRLLVATLVVATLAFFVPWALLTPALAGGGPLSRCEPDCPANGLQIGTNAEAVEFLGRWETYAMLALVVAVLFVYAVRIAKASRPQRRALVAVAVSSLLFLPIFFVYHFSRLILELDAGALEPMTWALVGIRLVLPFGFLAALLQAEVFAGAVRGRLLEQLLRRPSPQGWRDSVAVALDDPALRLGFWDPGAGRYRETDGTELIAPAPSSGRSTIEARRDGDRVAAMVIDDALAEDPELVQAAASATVLAVENGTLEGELLAARTRAREVGAAERRRIEGNLHDSAQQHLAALRINLELASGRRRGSEGQELRRFAADVERILDEVRVVASGASPRELVTGGVAAALRSLVLSAPMSVAVEDHGFGRRATPIETAVFFCCAEAIQNATKHAGPGASVTVRLGEDDGWLQFIVADDGLGYDPREAGRGQGLGSMADRVSALGGRLDMESVPGRGTRVTGRLPTGD